jgi:uncharacterized protein (TIGR02145 family)
MRLSLKEITIVIGLIFIAGIVKAQEFKTVIIGKQVWMAQNLSIVVPGSWAYNEDAELQSKYGRLYTWEAAQKACPKGWHIPTLQEWEEMLDYFGGEDKAGKVLKVGGSSGFNAKLAGLTGVGNFRLINSYGAFWTSTAVDKENAWLIYLSSESNAASSTYSIKNQGFSVRCIKNTR